MNAFLQYEICLCSHVCFGSLSIFILLAQAYKYHLGLHGHFHKLVWCMSSCPDVAEHTFNALSGALWLYVEMSSSFETCTHCMNCFNYKSQLEVRLQLVRTGGLWDTKYLIKQLPELFQALPSTSLQPLYHSLNPGGTPEPQVSLLQHAITPHVRPVPFSFDCIFVGFMGEGWGCRI